ncbi:hypothetical protein [Clostridium saccharoperbutylacetonicum]|uniref:hypothetical protein n=1 Tax=Clostridium saccharoperbutylacetonicum TaxID=36745 RepID=UPI00098404BB|nr:hypothetical protein [Clostridium saccharoperbutylacetonicum]AQR97534.1 hypothetical protein CLSAP_48590 [Clostridium saccharoperbutylacetonicum]NSB33418.1 uncharacterized DUF497 family protein [Clostridium saccharoperbutylacetonicum]
MSDNQFLSENEIKAIEEVKVEDELLEKVKERKNNILWEVLMKELLKTIKEKLDEDEEIDFYISGRDYTSDSVRLAFAATIGLSAVAHPVVGWSFNCILVKTNKRLLLIEVTGYLQYSKHYEIQKELGVVKEKEYFYLIIEDKNKNKKTIQYHMNRFEMIMDLLKDCATIVRGKKLKSKAEKIIRLIIIAWIIYLVFVMYFMIKNWGIIYKV